jgi:hypothetical protein
MPIVLNRKLSHKFENWCKFSWHVNAKSCKNNLCKKRPACTLIQQFHINFWHIHSNAHNNQTCILSRLWTEQNHKKYKVNFWVLKPQVTIFRVQNFCCNKPYEYKCIVCSKTLSLVNNSHMNIQLSLLELLHTLTHVCVLDVLNC